MKRHKELLGSGLDFAPVRLLGGFVCVDFHIGCDGCPGCLNRRHPGLDRVLQRELHLDAATLGLSTAHILDLVRRLPSYARAAVPVRVGHLTDWRYQVGQTEDLLAGLSPDYPIVLLSRHPLSEAQRRSVRAHRNALVHLSLAPRVPEWQRWYQAPQEVIASVKSLPVRQMLFMLRPLEESGAAEAERVLRALPAGANVAFKALSTEGIPETAGHLPMSPATLQRLRALALRLGLRVWDFFGCVLRRNLGRPFFKHVEVQRRAGEVCLACENQAICASPRGASDSAIEQELAFLGIAPRAITWANEGVRVETDDATARAEEVFLSEILQHEVRLSSVARGETKLMHFMPERIFERWQARGFFPVEEMRRFSALVQQRADP